jgi:FAD/FMN-containing dehydrogenase
MNQVLEIDERRQLARVRASVRWGDLMEALQAHRLMPRVYPGGAACSTVGEFVAQDGVGVGSFQYGSIGGNIVSSRPLEVTLKLQPLAPMQAVVAVFNRPADIEIGLADVARMELPLWSVSLLDRSAVDLHARLEGDEFELPTGRYAALFSYRGGDRLTVLPRLRGAVLAAGGRLLAAPGCHTRWLERFTGLASLGVTPVPSQCRVPLGELSGVLHAIPAEVRRKLAFEGVVADTARCVKLRFFLLEGALALSNA